MFNFVVKAYTKGIVARKVGALPDKKQSILNGDRNLLESYVEQFQSSLQ